MTKMGKAMRAVADSNDLAASTGIDLDRVVTSVWFVGGSLVTAGAVFFGLNKVPGAKKPDPILVASEISRWFGGLCAVDVDHLEVQRGAITALIGPNGAGKTTFFNLLTQFDTPDQGTVTFDGNATTGV